MTVEPKLKFYNTLSRQKQDFEPIERDNVRMYACGPTVYDFAHIGNARPVIVFDVLFRMLRHLYGSKHVTYVRNITDVDDKINARALRDFPQLPLNNAIQKVTQKTTNQFHDDVNSLGCLKPTHEPRATQHIDGMIAMTTILLDKANAYCAGGEVLFDVSSMPNYGKLSNRNLADQKAGARVAASSHKKNPGDFVLWKLSSDNEPGWESPWGRGRPGWHLECSVMSEHHLGKIFDIHGGGLDLIFPHHENEIAQSCCAHGSDRMANVWMHNGFLQVEGHKMAKSEGNFITIQQVLNRDLPLTMPTSSKLSAQEVKIAWNGLIARISMLKSNYREPINWTNSRMKASHDDLAAWYNELRAINFDANTPLTQIDEVILALANDLNTCDAIAIMHSFAKGRDSVKLGQAMKLLGLLDERFIKNHYVFTDQQTDLNDDEINQQIALRLSLIANQDYAGGDAIRAKLGQSGIHLKDTKDPKSGERRTTWEIRSK